MRSSSAYAGVSSFGFGGTNAHGMAWGRNLMTSRRGGRSERRTFLQRVAAAPLTEVVDAEARARSDPRGWRTAGIDPFAARPAELLVSVHSDGRVACEARPSAEPRYGYDFFLVGSFGEKPLALERSAEVPGLWSAELRLGAAGEEQFAVCADPEARQDMRFHPGEVGCQRKFAAVQGPDDPASLPEPFSWLIVGEPGAEFRIEVFVLRGLVKSVIWAAKR